MARIGLVGCVKTKLGRPAPARDLYVSTLFTGRREYVERSCDRWYVLSAEHGLIEPDTVIEPYDRALADQGRDYQTRWSARVLDQLQALEGDLTEHVFEVHAGESYRRDLIPSLWREGAPVVVPASGLTQGEQLAFYGTGKRPPDAPARRGPGRPPGSSYEPLTDWLRGQDAPSVRVTFHQIEQVLGRQLPRSAWKYQAWWANRDQNPQARAWMAAGRRASRPDFGRESVAFVLEPEPAPLQAGDAATVQSVPVSEAAVGGHDPAPVVEALLAHGRHLQESGADSRLVFTPEPRANELVYADPWAFLLGVIFDHGIRAERAWEAPYLLRQRLGYLEPSRLVANPDAVRQAVQQRPALHRSVNRLPVWVVSAAHRVLDHYGGDAAQIWAGQPGAAALQRRLMEFEGIGQKKAAMTVEILVTHLGVELSDLTTSDVAVDVHVRRVFLRTGLAQVDDPAHLIESARTAHEARPGLLDFPAWDVGRRWCHAQNPECGSCPLVAPCPRLVDRAAGVRGF